jgi:hypothetical protein
MRAKAATIRKNMIDVGAGVKVYWRRSSTHMGKPIYELTSTYTYSLFGTTYGYAIGERGSWKVMPRYWYWGQKNVKPLATVATLAEAAAFAYARHNDNMENN